LRVGMLRGDGGIWAASNIGLPVVQGPKRYTLALVDKYFTVVLSTQ
jgi:hypothetical protein